MQNQIATLKVDLSKSVEDATDAHAQTAQLTEANATKNNTKKMPVMEGCCIRTAQSYVDVLGLF